MASAAPARHVACIMDGNGRWATHRGLDRVHGHLAARTAVESIVDTAIDEGVEWLTLFAFSTENWSRPKEEVHFLVHFFTRHVIDSAVEYLHDRGVRLHILSCGTSQVPQDVMAALRDAEDLTRENTTLQLTVAFDYGGRQALVDAARSLITCAVPADEVTEETLARHMPQPQLPDVDVLIRTGGEQRLSNFLLWHCSYAELVFLDVLWPDFSAGHLRQALELYGLRQRRFGGLTGDTAPDGASDPAAAHTDPRATAPASSPFGPLGLPGLPGLPGPAALLGLPGSLAAHLGSRLLEGVRDTVRFAQGQVIGAAAGSGRAGRWS